MQKADDKQRAFEEEWRATNAQTELPTSMREGYFDPSGHVPLHHTNNRRYARYYLRAKAILTCGDAKLGCFTMDLSRQGIGLFSPIYLKELDRVQLRLPNGSELLLEITRCKQVDSQCYECGARFVAASSN